MSEGFSAEELWTEAHACVTRGDLIGGIRLLADCYERLHRDHDPRIAQVHARWVELYGIFTTLTEQREQAPAGAEAPAQADRSEAERATGDALAASIFGEELLAGDDLADDVLADDVLDAEMHAQGEAPGALAPHDQSPDGSGADEVLDGEILDGEILDGDVLEPEVGLSADSGGDLALGALPAGSTLSDQLFGDDEGSAGPSDAPTGFFSAGDTAGGALALAGPEPIRVEARSAFEEATSLAEQAESSVNEGDLAAGIAIYERLVEENPGNELVAERLAELRAAATRDEAQSAAPASLGTASLGTASLGTASLGTASWGTASSMEEPLADSPLVAAAPVADDDVAFLHALLQRVQERRRAL